MFTCSLLSMAAGVINFDLNVFIRNNLPTSLKSKKIDKHITFTGSLKTLYAVAFSLDV